MGIEFVPAICPKCGGELRVPNNRDVVKCLYCGSEIVFQNTTITSIENLLDLGRILEMAGNYLEAYKTYSAILSLDAKNSKAWLGKAKTIAILADKLYKKHYSEYSSEGERTSHYQEARTYVMTCIQFTDQSDIETCHRAGYVLEKITGYLWSVGLKHFGIEDYIRGHEQEWASNPQGCEEKYFDELIQDMKSFSKYLADFLLAQKLSSDERIRQKYMWKIVDYWFQREDTTKDEIIKKIDTEVSNWLKMAKDVGLKIDIEGWLDWLGEEVDDITFEKTCGDTPKLEEI